MALLVHKYGGSSVATPERIRNVAQRVATAKEAGSQMVVVVSAMGDTTDELLELARQVAREPSGRELDLLLSTGETMSIALLAMALRDMGQRAIGLTGAQAGIKTDRAYGRARITAVDPQRIHRELDRGRIVIVAGFQGMTEEMDITTLGRGGSDTTGVALAARLGAAECHIYTDVDGVYTADPRIYPRARKLKDISYQEMLELASLGAKVMHPRAVEIGEIYRVPILVASSFSYNLGTLIHGGVTMEQQNKVRGIAHDSDVAKITVVGVPDHPGIAASLFTTLAKAGISVDCIVQNASINKITDLTFTVSKDDLIRAMRVVEPKTKEIGARGCVSDPNLGKVSIVGAGMKSTSGYAATMFEALYRAGINIELITTSEIRITCIIAADRIPDAVQALHDAFQLEKEN